MPLLEDKNPPHLCPVLQTLALALANNVLRGITALDDFKRIKPPENDHVKTGIRPEMAEIPLIRSPHRKGDVGPTIIGLASRTRTMMTELTERASYEDRFTPYALRRGHSNMLDRRLATTSTRPG